MKLYFFLNITNWKLYIYFLFLQKLTRVPLKKTFRLAINNVSGKCDYILTFLHCIKTISKITKDNQHFYNDFKVFFILLSLKLYTKNRSSFWVFCVWKVGNVNSCQHNVYKNLPKLLQ